MEEEKHKRAESEESEASSVSAPAPDQMTPVQEGTETVSQVSESIFFSLSLLIGSWEIHRETKKGYIYIFCLEFCFWRMKITTAGNILLLVVVDRMLPEFVDLLS